MGAHTPPPFEVRPPEPGEIFYRLCDTDRPGADAFLSDEAAGRTSTIVRVASVALYRGFSARATLAQATSLARVIHKPVVAEIELSSDDGDAAARTLSTRGHHTVWAHAELVARRVRRVYPV